MNRRSNALQFGPIPRPCDKQRPIQDKSEFPKKKKSFLLPLRFLFRRKSASLVPGIHTTREAGSVSTWSRARASFSPPQAE